MATEGDFSFCKEHQHIFEYDYKIVNKMGEIAWKKLKEYNFETMKHDYIMETINNQLYPGHSALTYKLSTSHLKCIAVYGWDHFVNNYLSSNPGSSKENKVA